MKIKTTFLLLIVLLTISCALLIGLNLIYNSQSKMLMELQKDGFNATNYLQRFNIIIKDLLYSPYLDRSFEQWENTLGSGKEFLDNFFKNKILLRLVKKDSKLSDNYGLVEFMWQGAKKDIENATKQLKDEISSNPDLKKGLFLMIEESKGNYEYFNLYNRINSVGQKISLSFLDNFNTLLSDIDDNIKSIRKKSTLVSIIISISIVVILLLSFLTFSKSLNKKLLYLDNIMKKMAERDFSTDIVMSSKDEIGVLANYIKYTLTKLKEIFEKIKLLSVDTNNLTIMVSDEIKVNSNFLSEITSNIKKIRDEFEVFNTNITTSASSSQNIQNNLAELSEQIQSQSSTVLESSTSIEEIIASMNNISDATKAKKEAALLLSETVKKGDSDIAETNGYIQQIFKNTQNIQEILRIINSISSQINLLSMNAAIEAAHAGDAGKGFSVVAEEIRNLAESTSENAKNIGKYVQHIVNLINSTTELSNKNLTSFRSTSEEVNKFILLFEEIANGLEQMAIGSKEILNVNKILNSITMDIKEKYKNIVEENQEISASIANLNNISSSILESISDIYNKIEFIMNGTNKILQKQTETKNMVVSMNDELLKFKT